MHGGGCVIEIDALFSFFVSATLEEEPEAHYPESPFSVLELISIKINHENIKSLIRVITTFYSLGWAEFQRHKNSR